MSEFESNTMINTNKDTKKKKNKNKNKSKNEKTQQSKPLSAMGKLIAEKKRLQEEEEARIKKIEEEEEIKRKKEEERLEEIKRKEEELKEQRRKAKQEKIEAQKKAGTYKTKSEKEKEKKNKLRLEQMKKLGMLSDDGKIIINQNNILQKNKSELNDLEFENCENENSENKSIEEKPINNLRCPIFTIMGHVDTGKTTLLDYLRKTSVQSHEAGGITQQIGATLLTTDIIKKQIELTNNNLDINVPGLLLVDTPGHEAFKVLRKLGSKLADIAIVIIDIMHGLEPQTLESIKLLQESETPFIFALNKIDRLYGWDSKLTHLQINELIKNQDTNTQDEFNSRYRQLQTQIMSQGINCELFWLNESIEDTINIVPISGISGQGISDLLKCIIDYSQTILFEQIKWVDKIDCIAMEITNTDGYGYSLDCILKNGQLSKGDTIQIQSQYSNDLIKTKIKNILTIPNNKDSKSTSSFKYNQHQTIKGACQIKIIASNIESTLIGSQILLSNNKIEDESNNKIEDESNNKIEDESNNNNKIEDEINIIELDSQGISIFTSSRGSMESFVQFARTNPEIINPIQISYTSIGNVNKKELNKFYLGNISNLSEKDILPENLCVLAFEVDIDKDAIQFAKDNKITIFKDETIYRLFNQYKDYANKIYLDRKEMMRANTVFPCILKIIESNIFNKKNPLVMGVEVQEGSLHLGTPLIILPSKTYIGKVIGIQVNKQDVKIGKKGQSVCIKIDNQSNPGIMYGRHFSHKDILYPNITRSSMDILKKYFKPDISKEDIGLLVKLKKVIGF